jgi:hypothetical protein
MIDGSRAGSNSSCTAFAGLLQQCQKVELECVEGLRVVVLELEKGAVRNGLSSACCAVDFIITECLIGLRRRGRSQLRVQICE